MPQKYLEYWVLAQVGLEVGLTILVIFFLVRLKSLSQSLRESQPDKPGLSEEVARLTGQLVELEKKGAILQKMVEQLSTQAAVLNNQSDLMESQPQKRSSTRSSWENGTSLRFQVEALDRQGLTPEEIARRLRLNLAEVKVALDLSRVRAT